MKNTISNLGWGAAKSVMRIDWGGRSGVTIKVKNLRFREMNDEEKKNYDITGNKDAHDEVQSRSPSKLPLQQCLRLCREPCERECRQGDHQRKCVGNQDFALVEAMPNIDITECKKFAHRTSVNNGEFSLTLDRYAQYDGFTYDRLLSKWAIVGNLGETDTLLSHARYADEVAAISSPSKLTPATKKGVGGRPWQHIYARPR